ncbi:MAG: 4-(cytidine 5'-diphospho)-2-C-methyl-D-erythritol kinase, partial [Bacteroidales bacterium]|nr:4-(cytidine 5'-diphospho)-2-C-methyl-D-erythritol kinase [Bacteroidales bacterium]
MILYSPAKSNLGLRVTERRGDGFHNIETVFFPIGLSDIIEILPDKSHSLTKDDLSLSGALVPGEKSDNLLIRACRLFRERVDIPFYKIHLHKRIPVGAGLGGGSSDVASLLRGINMMAGYPLSDVSLSELALELGSDCVFFLDPVP